ncbi:MAG: hypothetical protein AAGK47_07920 [Bacteroidota bacterium]
MTEQRSKSRNVFQILALFLMLVILPFGSFYYLRKGFNYQKAAWAELQDRAVVPRFELRDLRGNIVDSDSLSRKIVVANFVSYDDLKDNALWVERFQQLSGQFHDRKEFEIISYLTDKDSLAANERAALLEGSGLRNPEQWHVLYGNSREVQKMADQFQFPNAASPYFALIDTLMVKNYYRADQLEEFSRMSQHIALILPRAIEKDIILERDKEM